MGWCVTTSPFTWAAYAGCVMLFPNDAEVPSILLSAVADARLLLPTGGLCWYCETLHYLHRDIFR